MTDKVIKTHKQTQSHGQTHIKSHFLLQRYLVEETNIKEIEPAVQKNTQRPQKNEKEQPAKFNGKHIKSWIQVPASKQSWN